MSKFDDTLFSRIALFNHYITQDQLNECVAQQEIEPTRKLGEIMLENGYLSREQIDSILKIRRKKIRKYLRTPKDIKEGMSASVIWR